MSRCYAIVVLALLVYGLTVGCRDGEHRVASVTEKLFLLRGGAEELEVAYFCKCGHRRPYLEVWR